MGTQHSGRLSTAEWRVMHALWATAGKKGATARDVLNALGPGTDWAYTTLKTMLDRLGEKKVVARDARGPSVLYRPLLTRDKARRKELDALQTGVFGGKAASLVHYLIPEERLSERDRQALRRLLQRAGLDPETEE